MQFSPISWRRLAVALLVIPFGLVGGAAIAQDPLASAAGGGLRVVDDALARLGEHRRMLMIAAHPDDEDTFLLTLVERAQHGEAAYLSLSRGDGGQNLIGDELGLGLGLLRSRELDAARRIDGAEQYFTRAYDFGFTRSLDETLERWPREVLLEETMEVVRRHRPQVLVTVFPPTPAAGHGQHQAAGVVAEEIFDLSRRLDDPFPDLGLEPWSIESFYRAAWFRPQQATMRLPLGNLDAFDGRSVFQTALLSRSQHRCQDMGFEQPPGDAENAVTWLAGRGGPDDQDPEAPDLFAGVETRLRAIADTVADLDLRAGLAADLIEIESLASKARLAASPARLDAAVAPLAKIVRILDGALAGLESAEPAAGISHAIALLSEKRDLARRGLASAAGVVADAITDRELVVPGESFDVRTLLWRSGGALGEVSVELESAAGWTVGGLEKTEPGRGFFTARVSDERLATVKVPDEASPDRPYFLDAPRIGDLYDWTGVDAETRTLPFGPPPVQARFRFSIDGATVELVREVVQRRRDQAIGEVRRPLRAVPAFEVELDRPLIVWRTERHQPETVKALIVSHLQEASTAELQVEVPAGWPAVAPLSVSIDAGGRAEVAIEIRPPATLVAGEGELSVALIHGGQRYTERYRPVDYGHVRPTVLPEAAKTSLRVIDLELPSLERVAYVRGATDRTPELLQAVGVPVELVTAEELMVLDLTDVDAVVLGPRAFEVEETLAAANARLLDYARGGGLVLVQYQQYAYSRGAYAPLQLEIRRPHDRITDETSPVRVAAADATLETPNRLGAADWDSWVQERGLYFAGVYDDAWRAPLSLQDPDGEPQRGGLLIAELGEGHYVYTGLAFFRQLPAGVPGAYRLLANLLALAEAD
ncbi:MAG: PIG-L family deacetylase [Acidobacteriota bacterium]